MLTSDDTIALPGFELNLAQALLRDATGTEVRLRPQAMSVLQFLARNAGRVVTKDELMQSVWASTVVTDDSLVQCVKEIRQALQDHEHRVVRTSPKRGYWLALPNGNGPGVSGVHANGADVAGGANGAATTGGMTAATDAEHAPVAPPEPSRRRFGLGMTAWAAGASAAMAGIAWWWLPGDRVARVQPRAEQPSIVVLPIKNISGGERWDRLARGLTEDITTDLARNHWLFIIASSAAFQRAAGDKDTLTIARELGVRFALEGSLQTEGEAVRVNARLLEASSGGSIWSQRWDKPAGQLFDIQDSIVGAIDSTLGSAWTGVIATADRAATRRRSTDSLAAYELFLLGVGLKHEFTRENFIKARDYLERAVQLDPAYAKAWVALAIAHVNLWNFAGDDASRQAEKAARRRAIEQAHRADPDDADALVQYSWLLATDGDAPASIAALRRSVAAAPNNADVLAVAALEGATKCQPADEALAWAMHAHRLNPNPPNWYHLAIGLPALYAHQFQRALDALAKSPDIPLRWYHGAAAHALSGDLAAGRRAVKRLLELNPGAAIRHIVADRGEWGSPKAVALFLEGARLAGMPE